MIVDVSMLATDPPAPPPACRRRVGCRPWFTRPLVAVLLALSVATTACGTRVSAGVRERAAAALLGRAGNGDTAAEGAAGATRDGGAPGAAASAEAGTGSGVSDGAIPRGGAGTAATADGSDGVMPNSAGPPTHCSSGGTKDIGLTGDTVTVGTVADLTGPVPGLFEAAVEGAQAWATSVNNSGGICGRQVKVQAADDGTDCGQNQTATQDMLTKVFAFVGSFSLYDDCGAKILQQHPDVADVHRALGLAAGQIPNNVSPGPAPAGYATGMFTYYANKLGSKVKKVGTIYPNIPSAAASQRWFMHSAQSQGWQFVYQRSAAAGETDWTSDFVKMCQQKHIEIFFAPTVTAKIAATMVQDERKAGCPKLVNIIPVAYDQAFIPDLGDPSLAEGILGFNSYALFFNSDEAQRIPELGRFQTWFKRVYPDKPINLYAMYSWADGLLFAQGLMAAGERASRASVMAALHTIHSFDANGMLAPVDPNSKSVGAHCYILWQIHRGSFQRVDTPATGYRCDGKFLPYNG